jgi:1-acyl-sn-glycerol-3-phosphate acyltransferase
VSDPRARPTRRAGLLGQPSARAGRLYRLLLAAVGVTGRRLLRLRLELVGAEHLPRTPAGRPAGRWIAAGLPHRTWVDPFVVATLLPVEPRLVYFGDGRAIFRSALRRRVFTAIGGVIPIWPGGGRDAVESHLAGAVAALDAGAVLCLFAETGPPVPVPEARPLGLGVAYFALRSGAPIVPLVLGGTHELYLGRRIRLVVLPPTDARELAGLPADTPLPEAWTAEERRLAHAIVATLHARTAPVVADAHRATEPPPGTRKRLLRLTRAFH